MWRIFSLCLFNMDETGLFHKQGKQTSFCVSGTVYLVANVPMTGYCGIVCFNNWRETETTCHKQFVKS